MRPPPWATLRRSDRLHPSLGAGDPRAAGCAPRSGPWAGSRSPATAGRLLALFCALVASGCAFVTTTVYVPTNAADTVRGSGCIPYAYFKREIADGVTLRIDYHGQGQSSSDLEIRVFLDYGKSLRFPDRRIGIASGSNTSVVEIEALFVAGHGYPGAPAPIDRYAPTEEMVGVDFVARTRQVSAIGLIDGTQPIVVSLPRILANGTYVDVAPITFAPEPHAKFCTLSA